MDEPVVTFQEQNFGDLSQTIRVDEPAGSGVEVLYPDENSGHIEALEKINKVIYEHYGDDISELADEDEEVIITRVTLPSDDLPQIEYSIVSEK